MQYMIKHNGVSCNLPVFTRSVKRRIDEVNTRISDSAELDERINVMHDFLTETVGEENFSKMLGGNIDGVDINDMNILYLKITKEYDRPVQEFSKPELDFDTKKMIQDLASVAKNIESIQQAAVNKK